MISVGSNILLKYQRFKSSGWNEDIGIDSNILVLGEDLIPLVFSKHIEEILN